MTLVTWHWIKRSVLPLLTITARLVKVDPNCSSDRSFVYEDYELNVVPDPSGRADW